MNAIMTWWAVGSALSANPALGNDLLSRQDILLYGPIFIAALVWLTRILIIGTFAFAGDHIFSTAERYSNVVDGLARPSGRIRTEHDDRGRDGGGNWFKRNVARRLPHSQPRAMPQRTPAPALTSRNEPLASSSYARAADANSDRRVYGAQRSFFGRGAGEDDREDGGLFSSRRSVETPRRPESRPSPAPERSITAPAPAYASAAREAYTPPTQRTAPAAQMAQVSRSSAEPAPSYTATWARRGRSCSPERPMRPEPARAASAAPSFGSATSNTTSSAASSASGSGRASTVRTVGSAFTRDPRPTTHATTTTVAADDPKIGGPELRATTPTSWNTSTWTQLHPRSVTNSQRAGPHPPGALLICEYNKSQLGRSERGPALEEIDGGSNPAPFVRLERSGSGGSLRRGLAVVGHFGALLLDRLPLQANQAVLDLGCGTGFPLLELAQRLGTTCRVTGADPWLVAMRRARRKQLIQQVSNVDLALSAGEALPFPAGHFDLVVSNLGINNFAAPLDVLTEVARVTRPGARLVLTTNLYGHMVEFYTVYADTLFELGHPELRAALEAQAAHRTTIPALRVLLASAGFYARRVDEQAYILRYVDGSAFLNYAFTQQAFMEGWLSILPSELEAEVFTCLEANLNRVAAARGELALTIPMAYVEAERRG